MLRQIKSTSMGKTNVHWLDSYHHFSFDQYDNPNRIDFGVLRVVNDDLVGVATGFSTHHHENMEIISYVIDGELTHTDSLGNKRNLKRGQVQYMSAGSGIDHSEYNYGHEILRFIQMWIYTDKPNIEPVYGDKLFTFEDRVDYWMKIASGSDDSSFPIKLNADVNIYATLIIRGDSMNFKVGDRLI